MFAGQCSPASVRRPVFAGRVENRHHVFEVHPSPIERRHGDRQFCIAGFDRNRQPLQVLQKLRQIRRARPRRQTEIAGLIENAVHVFGHCRRQVAHLTIMERPLGQIVDVGVGILRAIEMDRIDENPGVRAIHVLHHLAALGDGGNTAPRHRFNVERQTEGMGDFTKLRKIVFQTMNVVVVPSAEYLCGAETRSRFEERLPVDGARIGFETQDFNVQHLDARRLEVGFDFPDHRRIADHVVLRFRRSGRYQADTHVAVARLRRTQHLIGRIQIQDRERRQTDGTRQFQFRELLVL